MIVVTAEEFLGIFWDFFPWRPSETLQVGPSFPKAEFIDGWKAPVLSVESAADSQLFFFFEGLSKAKW